MIDGEPSRTAWSAALHRAAHQVIDGGRVFPDPVAVPITGWPPERVADDALLHPQRHGLRAFIACRHRYARDVLVAQGADAQVLVLGAGLDTTAYQPAAVQRGTVFEVDHPATQAWKIERLAEAGISPTAPVRYVPVDFETDDLTDALEAAGFDRTRPAVVVWLGVTVYLTAAAVDQTLASLGGLTTARIDLVLDYSEGDAGTGEVARRRTARVKRVAALGEPWLTHFSPSELAVLFAHHGFEVAEDLGRSGWGVRYLGLPPGTPHRPSGHLVHAIRTHRGREEALSQSS
jgi:methyltransferase (TIGR00027 family)